MADIGGSNGRLLQVRSQRKDGWTKAKRAAFLSVLSATCNATIAAKSVGKSEYTARALRKRDGEFSQLWDEALEAGYERLEGELLARALGQTPSGDNPSPEDIEAAPIPAIAFDPALAIKVLQLRGDIGRTRRPHAPRKELTQGEVDAMLLARLDALAERQKKA